MTSGRSRSRSLPLSAMAGEEITSAIKTMQAPRSHPGNPGNLIGSALAESDSSMPPPGTYRNPKGLAAAFSGMRKILKNCAKTLLKYNCKACVVGGGGVACSQICDI